MLMAGSTKTDICCQCGAERILVYQEVPSYHNDTDMEWRTRHDCLRDLVKRVKQLEDHRYFWSVKNE